MTIRVKRIVSSFLALALTACATARPHASVGGRMVEIQPASGERDSPVKGELLAVGPEHVWVLARDGVRGVLFAEIEQVRVRLHGLDGRKAWAWAALGAVATGVALTAACGSTDSDGCGKVFGITVGSWALLGAPSAASLAKSSRLFVHGPDFTPLRPYARFPQGLPEGLDPGSLHPGKPGGDAKGPLRYDRPKE
jgi:hypothetical protein